MNVSSTTDKQGVESPPDELHRQLDPGEELFWWGRPDAGLVLRKRFRARLPFAALLATVICAAVASFAYVDAALTRSGDPFSFARMTTLCYILGGAVLLYMVQDLIRTPGRLRRRVRGTLYGVTDRRMIFITTTRRGLSIQSYEPCHPLRIERTDDTHEFGDVSINPPPPPSDGSQPRVRGQYFLDSIPNPREVDRLIRSTFEPPAGARRFPRM